jgi:uncharacterized membrane protein
MSEAPMTETAWWAWVLLACALAFVTKFLGYSLPQRWLHSPRMTQVAACLTVALLASLTVMNTLASGTQLRFDARLAALAVAAAALWLRLPFLLVVILGAVAAALARWWS